MKRINSSLTGALLVTAYLTLGCQRSAESTKGDAPMDNSATTQISSGALRYGMTAWDPVSGNKAVMTVYSSGPDFSSGIPKSVDRILLALFANGRVVFADNSSFREGFIPATQLDQVLKTVFDIASIPVKRTSFLVPDGGFIAIVVADESRMLAMQSCHEIGEADGRAIATQNGFVTLNGRSSEEVKASWSPEFREFREHWDKLRYAIPTEKLEGIQAVDPRIVVLKVQ